MGQGEHEQEEDLEEWSIDYSGREWQFTVSHEQTGLRLDSCLAAQFPRVSRAQLQRWIADGQVLLDGKRAKSSATLRLGQGVWLCPPAPVATQDWAGQPMDLDIVHEDAQVIVVNKPAGLVVHPAAGHASGTLANGLIARFPDIRLVARSGIVHRLDRDTSGLMVAAKTPAAQFSLVSQLQQRTVSRQYLALAWGPVKEQEVHTAMGRDPRDRQRMAVVAAEKGKEAITRFSPQATGQLFGHTVSLLLCVLQTGRTHQIRVHAEYIKSPLVGDRTYSRHAPHANRLSGGKESIEKTIPGQALHAFRLSFLHPESGQKVGFSAPPPAAFQALCSLANIDLNLILAGVQP